MTKFLGVDFGQKRIGLAFGIYENNIKTVVPLKTCIFDSSKKWVNNIKELIDEKDIEAIICGMPFNLKNEITKSSENALKQVEILKKYINQNIYLHDEKYTTSLALQELKNSGISSRRLKNYIDSSAAAEILKSAFKFYESHNRFGDLF